MGIRVLVVEDAPAIADYLVRALREEGYTVELATDGHAARQRLLGETWDVVLLDRSLPGPDGVAVLKEFRGAGGTTPVLFLTARDSVSDRVQGLDAGAEDYLCKPFALDELLARVRSLGRRRDGRTTTVLTVGDVAVDLATHRVERAGQRVELAAREQTLLVLFLRHPGEVLSKTRIYEQVWDERYDGLSNTLEVHVAELRRKLELLGPRLIHTHRGRGYRFGQESPP